MLNASARPRESGDPALAKNWMPAFAGMSGKKLKRWPGGQSPTCVISLRHSLHPRWRAPPRFVTIADNQIVLVREEAMRSTLIGVVMSLVALPSLALADDDIVLRGMGSFHVGGRVAEVKGKEVRM